MRKNISVNMVTHFLARATEEKVTADIGQGRGYRQRTRETYQEGYGRNEETK